MHRIIVLDNLSQEGLDLLSSTEGIEFEVHTGLKGDKLRQSLSQYDGAICRSGVKITAESLAGNQRLKAIVRAGVGTDNIDKAAATRLGIVVMNTPAGNTLSTAEHAIALMLAMSRNIAPAYQSLIEGRWDRKKYMGSQMANKTIGVIGLGRIGQAVAHVANAFQMNVLGYDPFLSGERASELGITLVSAVRDILPEVDYLTVHTPLTPETKNLIDDEEIELIKPGARLINCARGGIYNEEALVRGLKSGKLAGVALDVYPSEPCTDSPLFGMPGVVCTPHLGASTEEAQIQVAIEGIQLLCDYLKTGTIKHSVNVSALDPETLASMRGYLDVAYRLGMMMSQWSCGVIQKCRLRYRGEITSKDTKMLTAAFAAGFLEGELEESVNIINAEVLLSDRGIELVAESHEDMGAFSSSITATINTPEKVYRAVGVLFGNNMPRLAKLGDNQLEAFLDGTMMFFEHKDIPGIIGIIGTILGKHKVNIGQMSVGRAGYTPGGVAIGVLNLDNQPPKEAMAEVRAHPAIQQATIINLPQSGEFPAWLATG